MVQTAGRAARNIEGRVIFYADRETDSMRRALRETRRRRTRQQAYNEEHGIEPRTIIKEIHNPLVAMSNLDLYSTEHPSFSAVAEDDGRPLRERIKDLEKRMKVAAKNLEFEEAAHLRDQLKELKELEIYTG